jgi:hypothetical protein
MMKKRSQLAKSIRQPDSARVRKSPEDRRPAAAVGVSVGIGDLRGPDPVRPYDLVGVDQHKERAMIETP